jgi:hypothetical protein
MVHECDKMNRPADATGKGTLGRVRRCVEPVYSKLGCLFSLVPLCASPRVHVRIPPPIYHVDYFSPDGAIREKSSILRCPQGAGTPMDCQMHWSHFLVFEKNDHISSQNNFRHRTQPRRGAKLSVFVAPMNIPCKATVRKPSEPMEFDGHPKTLNLRRQRSVVGVAQDVIGRSTIAGERLSHDRRRRLASKSSEEGSELVPGSFWLSCVGV